MSGARDPTAEAISFERVWEASVEDVWALWTTKKGIEAWYAPEGMRVEVLALEPHVGGAFDHIMTAVDAEQVAYFVDRNRPVSARVCGRFVEFVAHRRLRIRFDIDFVPGAASYPYDLTVDLHIEARRVRMIVTADRHPDAEMTRGAILGLTSQLKRFALAISPHTAIGK